MSQGPIRKQLPKITLLLGFFALLLLPGSDLLMGQVQSRAQEIQSARADKMAHLWPERESPLVERVNQLVERGLLEGAQTGLGANGWQIVMGGMRSGQGMTVGLAARGRSTFSELRWYPPMEAAKGSLSWVFRAKQPESVRTGP